MQKNFLAHETGKLTLTSFERVPKLFCSRTKTNNEDHLVDRKEMEIITSANIVVVAVLYLHCCQLGFCWNLFS